MEQKGFFCMSVYLFYLVNHLAKGMFLLKVCLFYSFTAHTSFIHKKIFVHDFHYVSVTTLEGLPYSLYGKKVNSAIALYRI
jgi:hypothetical protein